jgi:hypothetical protein
MGLDTYATQRDTGGEWEVAPDEPFDGIELCGGICSGGTGSSSIRGKVYAHVVQAATGESLYQQRIAPETVAEMARLLRAAVDEAQRAGIRAGTREFASVDQEGSLTSAAGSGWKPGSLQCSRWPARRSPTVRRRISPPGSRCAPSAAMPSRDGGRQRASRRGPHALISSTVTSCTE